MSHSVVAQDSRLSNGGDRREHIKYKKQLYPVLNERHMEGTVDSKRFMELGQKKKKKK